MQPDTQKKPEVLNPLSTTFNASNIGTRPAVFPSFAPPAPPPIPQPSINEQATSFAEATKQAPTTAEVQQTEAQSTFQKLSEKMFGKSAAQAAAETTQGVSEKSKAVSDIQSQINQLQNEATQASLTAENRQAPMFAITGEQAQIERMRSVKALQLNSFLYAAQGNLATAQSMADKAVATEFDPIEAQIKYTKDWLDMNKDNLSREDKKRADALALTLNERTRLLEEQKAVKSNINNIALEASKNGADAVTLNSIVKATTPEEALSIGLPFLQTAQTDVVKLDNGRTVVIDKRTGSILKDLGGAKGKEGGAAPLAGLTPEQQKDPFIAKLLATSGGKPITDTFAQQLNKGLAVLGQLGVLQANIKDVSTGPIVGAFRGANPWDTNAQTIKAQLNAIVPNLARGVYGEVGVLTDNDIAQYSKTLPNLKSPEDIRNAVLGITVDLIGKSIKRTLEINAANQKDVSGFVDLYTEMQATRDDIFSQIPGYKGAGTQSLQSIGVTKEDESLFDNTAGTLLEADQKTTGGFWSDIWKGLTGK